MSDLIEKIKKNISEKAERRISMSEVTRESQKAHIEKIKATIEKITEYRNSNIGKFESICLSNDDLDVIERALACHMCVITLDMGKAERQG